MARQKGMLNLSGNIEVNAGAPFDARDIIPTKADLTVASNFPYAYVGMETYVVAEDKKYRYMGGGVTDIANWAEVGSGGGGGTSYTAGDGIVIDNDEISIDEMASADMTEIVTPKPSVMSRRFKYSTEEQIVGTWIDGKPLYQKVYTSLNFGSTAGAWTNTGATISNADNLIQAYGIRSSDKSRVSFLAFRVNESNIQYYTISGAGVGEIDILVCQYTKTTD